MALQEELKTQGDYLFRNRSYLPLIILGVGMAVFIHTEYYEIETSETWLSEYFEFICLGISLTGLLIRIITVGYTPGNTSGRNTKEGQVADELNTTGVYSVVRHPLYVGNFFMWLGVAMLTENTWFIIAFVFFYAVYYERIMYAEENFLRKKFGQTYLQWAEKIPAFIPSLKNYTPPTVSFSIKKVLKKEKNGLCAIFLLFWIFDLVGDLIEAEEQHIETGFWMYAAVCATFLYLVLKVLKKRKLLDEKNR